MTDRLSRLVGCALALLLALALGACGGTRKAPPPATSSAGSGQGPTIHFGGGNLPGTVYFGAGPDLYSIDAYRVDGPLTKAQRITYSPVGLGLQGLAGNSSEVVLDRQCCGGLEFLERADLTRRGGLPGKFVADGTDPAVSSDGRFGYVVSNYENCGCDALLARPNLFGATSVIYKDPHPGTIAWTAISPTGELGIIVGKTQKDNVPSDLQILLDPGGTKQRRIQPDGPLTLTGGLWFGPRGELSFQVNGHVEIVSSSGKTQSVVLSSWQPQCWLPDDEILALSYAGGKVGLLNPRTGGTIKTIGSFSTNTNLFVLDCAT